MPFTNSWIETDPDGNVIPVSLLDDSIRLVKNALRERLEGDPAIPNLTGLIEVGSWPAAPKPRKGAARIYVDSYGNIQAYDATKAEDGRLAIDSVAFQLLHVGTGPLISPVSVARLASAGLLRWALDVNGNLVADAANGAQILSRAGLSAITARQPLLLFQSPGLITTNSLAEVSLASKLITANMLAADGNSLRVTAFGHNNTTAATFKVKLGADTPFNVAVPINRYFHLTMTIKRVGPGAYKMQERFETGDAASADFAATMGIASPGGISFAADNLLDFRGLVGGVGGLLELNDLSVELLAA